MRVREARLGFEVTGQAAAYAQGSPRGCLPDKLRPVGRAAVEKGGGEERGVLAVRVHDLRCLGYNLVQSGVGAVLHSLCTAEGAYGDVGAVGAGGPLVVATPAVAVGQHVELVRVRIVQTQGPATAFIPARVPAEDVSEGVGGGGRGDECRSSVADLHRDTARKRPRAIKRHPLVKVRHHAEDAPDALQPVPAIETMPPPAPGERLCRTTGGEGRWRVSYPAQPACTPTEEVAGALPAAAASAWLGER